MLLQRSKLAATTVERPRLAPTWLIALLGMMVLVVLIAIYPHQTLVKRVLEAPGGEITEAYLVNLLRTDPANPQLRMLLARNQVRAGLYDNVRSTLSPALGSDSPQIQMEAIWLLWKSEEGRLQRLPPDSKDRPKLRQALRLQLAEIADHPWSEGLLAEIARSAISFGDIALGLRLFDRLAAASTEHGDFWYAEAARSALANGEYRAAAQTFLIARARAASIQTQRRHFLDALRAMQSGDLLAEALPMAEKEIDKAPELANDSETLELLVRFARAARRPDLADKYARRLLRLSLLEQWGREQRLASGFDASPRRVAFNADDATPGSPGLPFDDRIYTLGFEAFLDNRKLEDAWKVAASAVRQAPDNLVWRERLARVSEWTGRPRIGLDNWLAIARATGRDDAWQAVLRLAPGLFDDEALRPALVYQLSRQPNDEKLLRELTATYERLGDPQGGLRFLEHAYSRSPQPWILELMADLAQRAGDEDQALGYWKRFRATSELTPARAVRVATLMLLRGQAEEGLQVLEKARDSATDADVEFWRLTAELASHTQQEGTAIGAYRRVIGTPEAVAEDYEALHLLLQDDFPLEAADVAAAAWRRFQQPSHLVQALGQYAARERWSEIRRLLAGMDAGQLAQLRRHPEFLQYSAQYHLNTGHPELARRDLESALQIAPDRPDLQLALIWLLIDSGNGSGLRSMLARQESLWRDDPSMHDALGTAYMALSLPDIALRRYYTPHLAEHRDDFLWLMNYADALEQNQETDRAWQLRQHLLARERSDRGVRSAWLTGPDSVEAQALRRIARARLVISQRQGDPGHAILRELLRLDRHAGKELSPAAKDVALGWLQENAENTVTRGWLWQQYAHTAARPMWAELTLALADNDNETAGQLLERYGERLPRYDRISAATRIHDLRLAQSDAFDTQTVQENDDPLHLQLNEALLAHSDHAGGEFFKREVDSIDESEQSARWHLAISPRLALDLSLGRIERTNDDDNVIGSAPDESFRGARIVWRHLDGESRFTAEERDSFERYHPLLFEHDQRIDDRLVFNIALGLQQPTTESAALRVAGMKDLARIGMRYRPTQRDQLSIEYRWEKFETQTDTRVGNGRILQIEAAHAIRIEPRDLEASVFWSANRYDRRSGVDDPQLNELLPSNTTWSDVGADFFLPENFRYYGIRLSTDMRFERQYTRAWRPYASVAKTWNSELGPGYELAAGIAGRVFGADHLSLGWRLGKGGNTTGGPVREIGLYYRFHY